MIYSFTIVVYEVYSDYVPGFVTNKSADMGLIERVILVQSSLYVFQNDTVVTDKVLVLRNDRLHQNRLSHQFVSIQFVQAFPI